MPLEYDSWFGAVKPLRNWRDGPPDRVPDDDAERPTPRDVTALLGFDPADEDEDEDEVEKEWDESAHPRGKTTAASTPGSFAPVDFPAGIAASREVRTAAERGAWDMRATRQPKTGMFGRDDDYEVEFRPNVIPEGIVEFKPRADRPSEFYDPELAELETVDPGTVIERQIPRPKLGLATEIEPLKEANVMYRGMSAEEFDLIRDTGQVASRGEYNIGEGQKGLTYWSTDAPSAEYYASGFAPWQYKATFDRPAYVVAAKIPQEVRNVPGTGENEIGVARPMRSDEIIGVWRGDVYSLKPATMRFKNRSYDPAQPHYEGAGGVGGSSGLVWRRVDRDIHKEWDESAHPRGKTTEASTPGSFAPAGGGVDRPVIQNAEDDPAFAERVRAGIKAIPPEHAARLKHMPVWVVDEFQPTMREILAGETRSHTQGAFNFPPGQTPYIEIARTSANPISRDTRPLVDPEGTTVHELGHALDYSTKYKRQLVAGDQTLDWGLSKSGKDNMGFDLMDGEKHLTRDEKANAHYFTRDLREMFAETYRLAYSPNNDEKVRYFGGLTRKRATEVFAKGLARVKALKLEPANA